MQFHQETLDNGLEVIAELTPSVHSVALGYFVKTGSRDETPEVSGVSHYLEHMAFKGNDEFTAEDVNRVFDEIGAEYNAATSEEVTLFYGAVLPEYLPTACKLLSAIIFPSLRQEDFDIEKKVILEEIGMYEDQPSFTVYENTMQQYFSKHPLGQCILGTTASVGALTSEQMRAYHVDRYKASNICLAVAGNVDWETVRNLAREHCGHWPAGPCARDIREAQPTQSVSVVTRESSVQQHVMQMAPAPAAQDDMRFAAKMLAVIVGDSSGSRLFWELVDPGECDCADMAFNEYDGSGAYATYLACTPEKTEENLERIARIFADVNLNGITDEELEQARNKVASAIVLGSERPMRRLSSLGATWLYRHEYRSVQDDLNELQAITLDDMRRLLDKYPLGSTTTVAVGPLTELKSTRSSLPAQTQAVP